jgi:hypothetical protein
MRRPTTRILFMLAALAAVVCVSGIGWGLLQLAQAAPTLTTDKYEYFSTETVTITGGGFAPNTLYDIPVIRPDGSIVIGDGSQTPGWDSVQSDGSGAFTYLYQLDGIPGTYEARAYPSSWDGDVSESPIATVTFTDGNVKAFAAPSGVTFTLTGTKYSTTTDCSGSGSTGTYYGVDSTSGKNFGVGNTESVKLEAAATSDQGGSFINWTSSDPFSDLGGGVICVQGFQGGGSQHYYANYGGTPTPVPTDTPVPPTDTPVPTDTNTPVPTDTNTPVPTDTNTPVPTDTNTPVPTDTNTPVPTDTNTPVPTDTNTPVPTDTNTPVPTATRTHTPLPPTATSTPVPSPPPGVGGTIRLPPAAIAAESVALSGESDRISVANATLALVVAGVAVIAAAGLTLSLAVRRVRS